MAEIRYRVGNDLDFEQYMTVYVQSTLGERRPVGDRERMRRMLDEANVLAAQNRAVPVLRDAAFPALAKEHGRRRHRHF